jgi:hypothetical protein
MISLITFATVVDLGDLATSSPSQLSRVGDYRTPESQFCTLIGVRSVGVSNLLENIRGVLAFH